MIEAAAEEIQHFRVLPFDPGRHLHFVSNSFSRSSGRPFEHLRLALARPGVVLLVAASPDDPDTLLGWLAAVPSENRIVYAYTKFVFRAVRTPDEEGFRIASSLAIAAGIDFTRPVPCTFFSRAAKKIAAKPGGHYRLIHSPEVFTA